jgi:hypothetical protein
LGLWRNNILELGINSEENVLEQALEESKAHLMELAVELCIPRWNGPYQGCSTVHNTHYQWVHFVSFPLFDKTQVSSEPFFWVTQKTAGFRVHRKIGASNKRGGYWQLRVLFQVPPRVFFLVAKFRYFSTNKLWNFWNFFF